MTAYYLKSTTGNDANNGLSWAQAFASWVSGASTIGYTAADTLYVSPAHNEVAAANILVNPGASGSASDFFKLMCVNDTATPPTASSTGATLGATTALTFTSGMYIYGFNLTCAAAINISTGPNSVSLVEKCNISLTGTTAVGINAGPVNPATTLNPVKVTFKNVNVKFNATTQAIQFFHAVFNWDGGAVMAGSVTPAAIFKSPLATRVSRGTINAVDFTALASTVNIFAGSATQAVIRNCALPASWSGVLFSGTMDTPSRYEMYNCDSGSSNYRVWIKDYFGELREDTTYVRTGGASDGTTPLSWKIVGTTYTNYMAGAFYSHDMAIWNSVVGTPVTLTVDILCDSATNLKNDQVWLEAQYPASSSSPLSAITSSGKADTLAAAADIPASAATWTTTSMTNPNKQKMSVTFTAQKVGWVICRIGCARSSGNPVYVDPKLQVS